MAFDPSQLIVGSAGFAYDWLITREWKRILIAAFPIYLAAIVFGLAFWSSLSNKGQLAQWYSELGNEEIAEWEDTVTPADASSDGAVASSEIAVVSDSDDGATEPPKISPFAEILFRRVQMLRPGDRSQYFVATSLLQQGAVGQAEQLLTSIAPNEGSAGYAPAHFQLANIYGFREKEDQAKYRPLRMHHLAQAARWNRLPVQTLVEAAEVYNSEGRVVEAANFQSMAAERDPAMNVGLATLARKMQNPKLAERASRNAEEHLADKIKEDSGDLEARIQLARLYQGMNKFAKAETALFSGVTGELTPDYKREQSNFLIFKFRRSIKVRDGKVDFSIGILEAALKVDPSNPNVATQVAEMVRMASSAPPEQLLDSLRNMLASGQANSTTHSLIAETYLDRGDMKSAIKHMEQVRQLAPEQAQNLNNLAFCIAEVAPERIDEAIELSNDALDLALNEPKTPVALIAEYYDTNAKVFATAGDNTKAITAIESAIDKANTALQGNTNLKANVDKRLKIERDQDQIERLNTLLVQVARTRRALLQSKSKYHQTAAELYRKQSDEGMAKVHEQFAASSIDQSKALEADGA